MNNVLVKRLDEIKSIVEGKGLATGFIPLAFEVSKRAEKYKTEREAKKASDPEALVAYTEEQAPPNGQLTYDEMIGALLMRIRDGVPFLKQITDLTTAAQAVTAENKKEDMSKAQDAVLAMIADNTEKLKERNVQADKERIQEEREAEKKLTSENICKPGFDKTLLAKPSKDDEEEEKPKKKTIEVLNQAGVEKAASAKGAEEQAAAKSAEGASSDADEDESDDDEEFKTSALARDFIKAGPSFEKTFAYISKHPKVCQSDLL